MWRFERRAMGSPLRLTLVGVRRGPRTAGVGGGLGADRGDRAVALAVPPDERPLRLNRRAGDPDGAARPGSPTSRAGGDRAGAGHGGRLRPTGPGRPRAPRLPAAGPTGHADRPAPTGFPAGEWLVREPRRTPGSPSPAGRYRAGIGKGLALRWAFAALARLLPEIPEPRFAAGRLRARGAGRGGVRRSARSSRRAATSSPAARRRRAGRGWSAIEDPVRGRRSRRSSPSGTARSARRRSRCTGGRRRTAERSITSLDPRTGEPGATGLRSVTVAGPDPAWAEVWSKTLFLEGARGIGPRARRARPRSVVGPRRRLARDDAGRPRAARPGCATRADHLAAAARFDVGRAEGRRRQPGVTSVRGPRSGRPGCPCRRPASGPRAARGAQAGRPPCALGPLPDPEQHPALHRQRDGLDRRPEEPVEARPRGCGAGTGRAGGWRRRRRARRRGPSDSSTDIGTPGVGVGRRRRCPDRGPPARGRAPARSPCTRKAGMSPLRSETMSPTARAWSSGTIVSTEWMSQPTRFSSQS